MTTTKTTDTGLCPAKEQAFKLRQLDTGWGWSFAHLLPFVGLYYACSRRTITPFLYAFLSNILIGVALGLSGAVDAEEDGAMLTLLNFATVPVFVKCGQNDARKHAAKKLGIEA